MKKTRKLNLAKQLRDAVRRSGLSLSAIHKQAGTSSYAIIHRFMGGGGLKLDQASKIAAVLGIEGFKVRRSRKD